MIYSLVGAPILLYRNKGSYTDLDVASTRAKSTSEFVGRCEILYKRQRAQAEWYYPINNDDEQHYQEDSDEGRQVSLELKVLNVLNKFLPQQLDHEVVVNYLVEFLSETDNEAFSSLKDLHDSLKFLFPEDQPETSWKIVQELAHIRKSKTRGPPKNEELRLLRDDHYQNEQLCRRQKIARIRLLSQLRTGSKKKYKVPQKIVRKFQKYELTYMPAKPRRRGLYSLAEDHMNTINKVLRNRLLYSDPAYLATPALSSLFEANKTNDFDNVRETENVDQGNVSLGNCIHCFACFCNVCLEKARQNDKAPSSWWILHPTGPLMDRIRLSHIQLASEDKIFDAWNKSNSSIVNQSKKEIQVGELVCQLIKCGTNKYIVRTLASCTLFEVVQQNCFDDSTEEDMCLGGLLSLRVIQSMDSLFGSIGGYTPRYVTAHPKYGGSWTDSKIAVVLSDPGGECNSIEHINVGGSELRTSHHHITNLQDIGPIDFSKQNPIVLWSAARSFVRPTPVLDTKFDHPMLGHGYSLYSIDLRAGNKATFHWSPSAHCHLVEGVYSISAIMTNWEEDHSLLVASKVARKTWELDVRMPFRVVNTWSLPHMCDADTQGPNLGNHDTGFIFACLSSTDGCQSMGEQSNPFFGISCSSESFGIHLYQRPSIRPRFETDSVECANFLGSKKNSIASSSCFPLPDVHRNVHSIGLFPFRVPANKLHSDALFENPDLSSAVCVATATKKGDIYIHTLLESQFPLKQQICTENLPIGTAAIPVPEDDSPVGSDKKAVGLHLKLKNQFPVPSHAILKLQKQKAHGFKKQSRGRSERVSNDVLTQEILDGVSIKSLGPKLFVLKNDKNLPEDQLKIPEELMGAAERELLTTMDCFEPLPIPDRKALGGISDVTASALSGLENSWDRRDQDEIEHDLVEI